MDEWMNGCVQASKQVYFVALCQAETSVVQLMFAVPACTVLVPHFAVL